MDGNEKKTQFDVIMAEGGNAELGAEALSVATVLEKNISCRSINNQPTLEEYRQVLNNKIMLFNAVFEARRSVVAGGEDALEDELLPFDERVISVLRKIED
jgi:hypothetical protein